MNYRLPLLAVIAVVTAGYPFVVYFSLQAYGPSLLSFALFVLLIGRVVLRGEYHQPEQYVQLILVGSLCLLATLFASEGLLRYYPVMMSLSFALFFIVSLNADTTLVQRFASIFMDEFEEFQIWYMRRLTVAWAILLIVNAGVAAYTACCMPLSAWALYNGAIAYGVIASFMAVELIVRYFYKKRHFAREEARLQAQLDTELK